MTFNQENAHVNLLMKVPNCRIELSQLAKNDIWIFYFTVYLNISIMNVNRKASLLTFIDSLPLGFLSTSQRSQRLTVSNC